MKFVINEEVYGIKCAKLHNAAQNAQLKMLVRVPFRASRDFKDRNLIIARLTALEDNVAAMVPEASICSPAPRPKSSTWVQPQVSTFSGGGG
jgi:hypothetical protein